MKVIDSSSLAKYVNKEPGWERVSKQLAQRSSTFEFALQEVGNSVWKRVLKKEIREQDALTVFQEFVQAVLKDGLVTLVPMEADLLISSLKLAIDEKLTIYDSSFIELAHKKKLGLITSDERQKDISKRRYSTMPVEYVR